MVKSSTFSYHVLLIIFCFGSHSFSLDFLFFFFFWVIHLHHIFYFRSFSLSLPQLLAFIEHAIKSTIIRNKRRDTQRHTRQYIYIQIIDLQKQILATGSNLLACCSYAPSQLVSDNRPREDVTQSVKPTQQKGKGHRRSYSVEA